MSRKNQRLNATITIGSVLEGSVKRNIGVLKSGLNQVGDAIKQVERRQKELDRQRNVLRRQGQSVEHLDREYEKLEATLKDLRRAQERWNRAAAASRRVGSTFRSLAADIGRVVRQLTIGASLAGGAIFGLASSTAQLGDNVAKTADKLGIGIEALQELRYAAERSGVSTSDFDTALEKMTKNIGLALEGTGAQKDALDALGLSAAELSTMLPEEALALIADRMNGVATQAEKAALANDIFGRSGIGMINMLRGGSDGLAQLREDARRTGYVLSEQAARDAEVFQDTLLDTQLVLTGLKNTVGAELMPVVTHAMRRVGDALIENRDVVKRWSEGFADGVERALPLIGDVLVGIGQVSSVVWGVTEGTAEMVGGWENFGIIIGTVLAARTVVRVVKFGAAVFSLGKALFGLVRTGPLVVGAIRAIGSALLMNPIGLAVAAIAGAAFLIYKNWGTVGPWFKGLWGEVKTYFHGFKEFVAGVFTGDLGRAWDGIKEMWGGAKGFWQDIWDGVGAIFTSTWENVIKPVTDAMGITEPIEQGWKRAKAALGPTLDGIGQIFTGAGAVINSVFAGDMQGVADGLGSMWSGAKTALQPTINGIGAVFSATWENVIKPVTDKMGVTDNIERAWSSAKSSIGTYLDDMGTAFAEMWSTKAADVIAALQNTDAIGQAWENVKAALGVVLDWIGQKFEWLGSIITPVIDGLKWAKEKGAAAVGAISGALGIGSGPEEAPRPSDGFTGPMPAQERALGGAFRPGWLLTGERGPELKFESRSGYIANNRALRQLAGYAASATRATAQSGMAARVADLFAPAPSLAPAPAMATANQVTQNITYTINAAGASAEEVIRLVERKSRQAAGNGLFDRAPSIGPYGR